MATTSRQLLPILCYYPQQFPTLDLLIITDRLTIKDLQKVKNALWDARPKWRDLGEEIGVDDATLESISVTERDRPGDCFRQMLAGWLKGAHRSDQPNSKPRTWRTLIDALRVKSIDFSDLANEIEAKEYGTIQGTFREL